MNVRIPAAALLTLVAALGLAPAAGQSSYPDRHVRIITAGVGTTTDLFARQLSGQLSERWGKSVIVDNQPAAALTIGASMAARAAPDGYTLLLADRSPLTVGPVFYKDVTYDPVKDFAPIALLGSAPMLVVGNPSLPASNLRDLIRYLRERPGKVDYASAGSGTAVHMTGELFNHAAGTAINAIPYKGGGPAILAVVRGEVALGFGSAAATMPLVKGGKLRAFAVASARRIAAAPDVPTAAEAGLAGFESAQWFGLLAPAGTPDAIVRKIHRDVSEIMATTEMQNALAAQGVEFAPSSPAEFASFIAAQTVSLRTLAEHTGMHAE